MFVKSPRGGGRGGRRRDEVGRVVPGGNGDNDIVGKISDRYDEAGMAAAMSNVSLAFRDR